LLKYLQDQVNSSGEPPSDTTIVVESFLDEVGDWRVAILSPFGARVHAPWATVVAARLRAESAEEVDMMWSDDGIVFRLPEASELPAPEVLLPDPDEVEDILVRELGSTALFAARFRENAARALLLPRRQPGRRSPLWLQRRRATDLLKVASRFPNFPILLETYRECLRDVFDIKGLRQILQDVQRRAIRIHHVETQTASPFAASLLFNYTANFIYEGDTPLAERRAQTLALDHAQLRELLGDAELRELLCGDAVDQVYLELQRLDERFRARHEDDLQDLLRHLGDLSQEEIATRTLPQAVESGALSVWLQTLVDQRRVLRIRIAGESRYAAAEDAARFRDALGTVPPPGLPEAFLQQVDDPLGDLVSRYARTHVPFQATDVAQRLGLGLAPVQAALEKLLACGRILEGEFLPGGRGREWCDAHVLRLLKRRSLSQLRKQVEPVEPEALVRFLAHNLAVDWMGCWT
jgi:ATP-dependent Lhr-like helicase